MKKILCLALVLFLGVFLSSCATGPITPPPPPVPLGPRVDIIHIVGPGETLWRIGKIYDVPPDMIIKTNSLSDPNALKMGQHLTIPNATSPKPIITLYPSRKWKYIIIHHSATEEGNALAFYFSHKGKGWDTVGYDFVIDNGSNSRKDGQLETTPRWLKQLDGAHCKTSNMNVKAIGICLVGNFSEEQVTPQQMETLVYLVNKLRSYYRIPVKNILRHGEVSGASTACPGSRFPWKEFKSRLR